MLVWMVVCSRCRGVVSELYFGPGVARGIWVGSELTAGGLWLIRLGPRQQMYRNW